MGCYSSKVTDDPPLPARVQHEHNSAPRTTSPTPSAISFQYPEEHQMTPNSSLTFEALAKHASRTSKASRAASKASRSSARAASRDASTRGFRNRSRTSSGATDAGSGAATTHSPESRQNQGHSFDRVGMNAFMAMHRGNKNKGTPMAGTWPPADVPQNQKERKNWAHRSQAEMSKAKSSSKKERNALRKRPTQKRGHGHEHSDGREPSGRVEEHGTTTGFEEIPLAEMRAQQVNNSQAQGKAKAKATTTHVHIDTIATDWDRIATAVAVPERRAVRFPFEEPANARFDTNGSERGFSSSSQMDGSTGNANFEAEQQHIESDEKETSPGKKGGPYPSSY